MFKLISLYSPTNLFETITFQDGLNIIVGRYSKEGKDINGIGKTTIIQLIDYCLLADGPKKQFFSDKFRFLHSHIVCLKFKLGNDTFIIERGFRDKKSVNLIQNQDKRIPYTDLDLRMVLGAKMVQKPDYKGIYDPAWFRTLMGFFIQDDHSFHARTAKNILDFSIGKRQPELLTYCLLIMGMDNSLIWSYDTEKVELKKLRSDKTRISKQILEETGKTVDDFKGQYESVNRKIKKLEEGLSDYNFVENSSNIEEKLSGLSSKISSLNKEHLNFYKKLEDIKESLEISVEVDVEKIKNSYLNLNKEFSAFIEKSLEEVLSFRKQISTNRSKFLKSREQQYAEKIDVIKETLVSLEKERSKLYKLLDEHSAFDAVKAAYSNLLKEQSDLASQKAYIEQLDNIERRISKKDAIIGRVVSEIVERKSEADDHVELSKNIFLDIVENSVDTDEADVAPYYDLVYQSNKNSPMKINTEVPRGSSMGKGRFKILAFDLTMFLTSRLQDFNLPNFLIHDGVFHGIAHKTRIKYLNYMNKTLSEYPNTQYIVTINEDEIIFPEEENISATLNFDLLEKTIITLKDIPDKMLLGKEFG